METAWIFEVIAWTGVVLSVCSMCRVQKRIYCREEDAHVLPGDFAALLWVSVLMSLSGHILGWW